MKNYVPGIAVMICLTFPTASPAQDASYYTCFNQVIPVTIPALPLNEALEIYTQITRCPVSKDFRRSAAGRSRKIITHQIRVQMTPEAALRAMLVGTPIKVRPIHGGYSIY